MVVEAHVHVLRSAAEVAPGVETQVGHASWPWLAEPAACLPDLVEVGHDGKTPYERCKGKRRRLPGLTFAKEVCWKRKHARGRSSQQADVHVHRASGSGVTVAPMFVQSVVARM